MRIRAIQRFVDSLKVTKGGKTYVPFAGQVKLVKTAIKMINQHKDPKNQRLLWERVLTKANSVGTFGRPETASQRKGRTPHHDVLMNPKGIIRQATEPYDNDRFRK